MNGNGLAILMYFIGVLIGFFAGCYYVSNKQLDCYEFIHRPATDTTEYYQPTKEELSDDR